MFLKRLTCHGFKSFADKTEFDFPRGITGIVGPNGCGKSNVVDAIKWVLGDQSARSLRGKQMMDVIFNGSMTRPSSGVAQVEMVFDNASGRLPVDQPEVVPGIGTCSVRSDEDRPRTAAILYSLTQSAKRNGVDPFAYLRDLLRRIPTHLQSRIDELLPDNWKQRALSE